MEEIKTDKEETLEISRGALGVSVHDIYTTSNKRTCPQFVLKVSPACSLEACLRKIIEFPREDVVAFVLKACRQIHRRPVAIVDHSKCQGGCDGNFDIKYEQGERSAHFEIHYRPDDKRAYNVTRFSKGVRDWHWPTDLHAPFNSVKPAADIIDQWLNVSTPSSSSSSSSHPVSVLNAQSEFSDLLQDSYMVELDKMLRKYLDQRTEELVRSIMRVCKLLDYRIKSVSYMPTYGDISVSYRINLRRAASVQTSAEWDYTVTPYLIRKKDMEKKGDCDHTSDDCSHLLSLVYDHVGTPELAAKYIHKFASIPDEAFDAGEASDVELLSEDDK